MDHTGDIGRQLPIRLDQFGLDIASLLVDGGFRKAGPAGDDCKIKLFDEVRALSELEPTNLDQTAITSVTAREELLKNRTSSQQSLCLLNLLPHVNTYLPTTP